MITGGMLIGPEGDDLAATCVEKLATFLDDEDQNLKYIALLALVKIIPSHPHLVAQHQEPIFDAMEDDDLSIRLRALDLVSGMAGRSNYKSIVEHQLKHLDPSRIARAPSAAASLKNALQGNSASHAAAPALWLTPSYRLEIVTRILNLGYLDTYSNVVDFEWYIDVLIKLAYMANDSVGDQVSFQLIDVASRVRGVRPHAIAKLKQVLEDFTLFDEACETEFQPLRAAAWICGEYCQSVSYPPALITLLVRKETLATCTPVTTAMMLHNAVKLLAWWLLELSKDWKEEILSSVRAMTGEVSEALQCWVESDDAEVEERAVEYGQLLLLLQKDLESYSLKGTEEGDVTPQNEPVTDGPKSLLLLSPLFFGHTLGPVAKKAQGKVALPASLDLDQWIVDPGQVEILDLWDVQDQKEIVKESKKAGGKARKPDAAEDKRGASRAEANEKARLRAERLKRQHESPFYIGSKAGTAKDVEDLDIDEIPIVQLQLDDMLPEQGAKQEAQVQQQQTSGPSAAPAPLQQEEEEMPEESEGAVLRRKVGKKKKAKAVREGSLS